MIAVAVLEYLPLSSRSDYVRHATLPVCLDASVGCRTKDSSPASVLYGNSIALGLGCEPKVCWAAFSTSMRADATCGVVLHRKSSASEHIKNGRHRHAALSSMALLQAAAEL
jgi:hypothetical protein